MLNRPRRRVHRRVARRPVTGRRSRRCPRRGNRGEQVIRLADPQQVPRLVVRQFVGAPADDGGQVLLLQRPTDTEAVEAEVGQRPRARLPAQILVLRALHHPEQGLIRLVVAHLGEPAVLGHAAHRPVVGAAHRLFLITAGVHQRGQLVEGEDDVRARADAGCRWTPQG